MKDVIEKVISEIKKNIEYGKDELLLLEKKIRINKANFHEIKRMKSSKTLVFIDGGNAELISTPNISLQIIRIFHSIYRNNKREKLGITEFYQLTVAEGNKDKIKYRVEIFPFKGKTSLESFVFDSKERSISMGDKRAEISRTGDIIRRLAELDKARELASLKNSIIILDGNLEAVYPGEDIILNSLYDEAVKNKNIVCALSKTSRLFTDKGSSLLSYLNNIKAGTWYYPIRDKGKGFDIYFIKLNNKSEHLFRFDVLKGYKYSENELFWLLKDNSRDLTFPGYPFGLIEADKYARVSNNEKNTLKMIFLARMGVLAKDIKNLSSSIDAHSILDRLVNTYQ